MIDWVAAAFTSAKAAGDIAKSLLTLRDEESVRARVFDLTASLMDLQQQMMTAQLEQMALIQKIGELEATLKVATARGNVLDRYELIGVGPGKVVYSLKEEFTGTEPAHLCCTSCYDQGKRSVFKATKQNGATTMRFACPACQHYLHIQEQFLPRSLRLA